MGGNKGDVTGMAVSRRSIVRVLSLEGAPILVIGSGDVKVAPEVDASPPEHGIPWARKRGGAQYGGVQRLAQRRPEAPFGIPWEASNFRPVIAFPAAEPLLLLPAGT